MTGCGGREKRGSCGRFPVGVRNGLGFEGGSAIGGAADGCIGGGGKLGTAGATGGIGGGGGGFGGRSQRTRPDV